MSQSKRQPQPNIWQFFLLTFLLAIPFWLLGVVAKIQLLPGLPIAALDAFCPAAAALILAYRQRQRAGVTTLLKRSFDARQVNNAAWYVPALFLMPGVGLISLIVLAATGTRVPRPAITIVQIVTLCAIFFLGALGEELGWSGYVQDPMLAKWGALTTSLSLGLIWAAYHYVPLTQANRSLAWIAWWALGTVCLRIIMVWLYTHTGRSVFVAALFHMATNVTWQLLPVNGSLYDPRIIGTILSLIAVGIVLLERREWRRVSVGIC